MRSLVQPAAAYESGISCSINNDPERGNYASFEAQLSYCLLYYR